MANDWFRLRERGEGSQSDPYRPELHGHDLDYSGNKKHPDGAPFWIVRVYGTETEVDALETDLSNGEQRLRSVPVEALGAMLGQNKSIDEWEAAFDLGK